MACKMHNMYKFQRIKQIQQDAHVIPKGKTVELSLCFIFPPPSRAREIKVVVKSVRY